jgi:hypothetical protein
MYETSQDLTQPFVDVTAMERRENICMETVRERQLRSLRCKETVSTYPSSRHRTTPVSTISEMLPYSSIGFVVLSVNGQPECHNTRTFNKPRVPGTNVRTAELPPSGWTWTNICQPSFGGRNRTIVQSKDCIYATFASIFPP